MPVVDLFVYGTLMRGFRNHDRFFAGRVLSVRGAAVRGRLVHLRGRGCPALLPGEGFARGEVLAFEDDAALSLLSSVDDMELYFGDGGSSEVAFLRERAEAFFDDGSIGRVFVYRYRGAVDAADVEVPGGDWRAFMERSPSAIPGGIE